MTVDLEIDYEFPHCIIAFTDVVKSGIIVVYNSKDEVSYEKAILWAYGSVHIFNMCV